MMVFTDAAGALVTERGAAVQLLPAVVLMLFIKEDIATSCSRLGPVLLEPGCI